MVNRESKYELLRIIAMILIIMHHICMHCVYPQLNDASLFWKYDNAWFREPIIYPRVLALDVFATVGKIADELFVLLTGYFMVEKNQKIQIGNKIATLISQAFFVAIGLVLVSVFYRIILKKENINLFSIQSFNDEWWFIGYYIFIITVAYLGVNKYLNAVTRERYRTFLIVLFASLSVGWIGNMLADYANGLRAAITGVFLYSLGGYIKKYNIFMNIKTYSLIMVILLMYVITFLSKINTISNSIDVYKVMNTEGDFLPITTYYQDYNIVPIIIGVALFEIFRRISIRNTLIINKISRATFMMYLIHDNGFVHSVWQERDWVSLLHESIFLFAVHILVQVLIVMFVGVISYYVYVLIDKRIKKAWFK